MLCIAKNYITCTVQLKCNFVTLMPARIAHAVFYLLPVPACACARIHASQRITVTGNDVGSSPPFSVLHAGFLFYIC